MTHQIAILLCTYNGQTFLPAQLDSLAAQTVQDWHLWVSDDGSDDTTLDVLRHYQAQWGHDRLTILDGPGCGPAANFLSLVHDDRINADYFAYCDQDDIWEPAKLQRALDTLHTYQNGLQPPQNGDTDRPLLYGSRTRYIDENDREIGLSALFTKPPGFANAMVQCIAGGNTMVFNKATRCVLKHAPSTQATVMHDWWTYIAVTACGGQVVYDPWPSVRYRQHRANQLGMNVGLMGQLQRARGLLDGHYRVWNVTNIAALQCLEPLLTPAARDLLKDFRVIHDGSVFQRTASFFKSGVYRQRSLDNLALAAMAVLGRL